MAEVLSIPRQPNGQPYFAPGALRRSSASTPSLFLGASSTHCPLPNRSHNQSTPPREVPNSLPSTAPSSPQLSHGDFSHSSSFATTPGSSLYFDTRPDDDLAFPSYGDSYFKGEKPEPSRFLASSQGDDSSTSSLHTGSTPSDVSRPDSPEPIHGAEDDTAVRDEPSQQVDYLSHNWREEDIWSSWRHIVSRRKFYGERARLENASWRSWAKAKYRLKTVSPEKLNWLKDCDVTWLYGPLQTRNERRPCGCNASEPTSRLSKSNSFSNKKPILKKRSVSEVMLQRSISASSLVKQAAAAVQAQQRWRSAGERRIRDKPSIGRTASDIVASSSTSRTGSRAPSNFPSQSSSGFISPETHERRHIRFDNKVEQCIAVDIKEEDFEEDYDDRWGVFNEDSSSDDGLYMIRSTVAKPHARRRSERNSSSSDSKTIAMLPSTTLKYRGSPDIPNEPTRNDSAYQKTTALSHSASQETLRPSKPSTNFLLDDDDEDADMGWEPSGAFANRRDSVTVTRDRAPPMSTSDSSGEGGVGLRRTPSGMFMPYEEDEDDIVAEGLFGRVINTVNTARDIAHVIWNVGWRK